MTNSNLPFIDAINGNGLSNIVFQQDNTQPHKAKKTLKLLENWAKEHGFSRIEWPPYSPDMNPIEELWAHLKTELYRRYPGTRMLQGSPDTIRKILIE